MQAFALHLSSVVSIQVCMPLVISECSVHARKCEQTTNPPSKVQDVRFNLVYGFGFIFQAILHIYSMCVSSWNM